MFTFGYHSFDPWPYHLHKYIRRKKKAWISSTIDLGSDPEVGRCCRSGGGHSCRGPCETDFSERYDAIIHNMINMCIVFYSIFHYLIYSYSSWCFSGCFKNWCCRWLTFSQTILEAGWFKRPALLIDGRSKNQPLFWMVYNVNRINTTINIG